MALKTFTWCVDAGATRTTAIKANTVSFGDGYEQVSSFGINNIRESWQVTKTAYKAELDAIHDFLIEHKGVMPFYVTIAGETKTYRTDASIIESLYARGSHVTRSETASTLMFRYGPTLFLSTGPALAGLSFANSNSGDIRTFSGTDGNAADIVSYKIYTSGNTNIGTNGVLSAKSPVTHLYHDRVEHTGNDKELEPIEFVKLGVGDYLLKNTTGLAQDGWYIVIPQDANGNPLIAVEYVDNDGDISVKTYKRKFDYEQAKVVPDLNQPLDIPDGRWIDLRFNDLPDGDAPLPDEV